MSSAPSSDAETVLAQLVTWFDDDNRQAPHSALGMRAPVDSHWAELFAVLRERRQEHRTPA